MGEAFVYQFEDFFSNVGSNSRVVGWVEPQDVAVTAYDFIMLVLNITL